MKLQTLHALLNDIEKLNNYLHRYLSRADTARTALGLPGTIMLNRVLGYVKKVRKEISELEAMQKGMRPLMAAENEIDTLKSQIAVLQREAEGLRQQNDHQALNVASYKKATEKAKSELNTLTVKYNQIKSEQVCH